MNRQVDWLRGALQKEFMTLEQIADKWTSEAFVTIYGTRPDSNHPTYKAMRVACIATAQAYLASKERTVKDVRDDGSFQLMTKAEEKKWRKRTKTRIVNP